MEERNLPTLPTTNVNKWGMSAEEVRDRFAAYGNDDPEAGHGAIDDLLVKVLEAIRDGHPDPQGLAAAALIVDEADFPRWYA